MSLLTIDKEKCKQDGMCAADCPTNVISFKGPNNYPKVKPYAEKMCLRCGHCVAVCPHGALDHKDIPLAHCPPIQKALAVSEEQAVQFLRSRRSIRHFKERPVPKEALKRLIEIARYAPTGSNSQLVEWVVINDKERLHKVCEQTVDWMRSVQKTDPLLESMPYLPLLVKAWDKGQDVVLRGAPSLVVAMSSSPTEDHNGMVNLSLMLSYLELAAPLFNLGTCWAGVLQRAMLAVPAMKQAVGVPEDYSHHYPMMIGYSKLRYHRLPERKPPKITWR